MMRRFTDWQDRLASYLAGREGLAFHWAVNSCGTFATGAVTAMTGVDPWADDRAAIAGLRRRGRVIRYVHEYGGNLQGAADKWMRRAGLVPVLAAAEGDIIYARILGTHSLGVCLGRVSAFLSPQGLVRVKPDAILQAWGVR